MREYDVETQMLEFIEIKMDCRYKARGRAGFRGKSREVNLCAETWKMIYLKSMIIRRKGKRNP